MDRNNFVLGGINSNLLETKLTYTVAVLCSLLFADSLLAPRVDLKRFRRLTALRRRFRTRVI